MFGNEDLKENIRAEIKHINPETLNSVMVNVLERAKQYENENGGQFRGTVPLNCAEII